MNYGRQWTTIAAVKTAVNKKWSNGGILRETLDNQGLFPMKMALSGPTPLELSERYSEVKEWIREYLESDVTKPFRIEWKEVNNRIIGNNKIPTAVIFESPSQAAKLLGRTKELALFTKASSEILSRFPDLSPWLAKNPLKVIEAAPIINRVLDVIDWIYEHPRPGIYLRQLCVKGVDSKFLESHKRIITDWLDLVLSGDQINCAYTGTKLFEKRFGFLSKPTMVRFRMLDSRQTVGGYSDVMVRADEFCAIPQAIGTVFVTENDINGLSFPRVKDAMILFGRGYGFDFLLDAHWLQEKEIYYWGDIDTHGFAILSQFREYFPRTHSFLMDCKVLHECRESWSEEVEQFPGVPQRLNNDELALFNAIKKDRYGKSIRLEQELIPFDLVEAILEEIENLQLD